MNSDFIRNNIDTIKLLQQTKIDLAEKSSDRIAKCHQFYKELFAKLTIEYHDTISKLEANFATISKNIESAIDICEVNIGQIEAKKLLNQEINDFMKFPVFTFNVNVIDTVIDKNKLTLTEETIDITVVDWILISISPQLSENFIKEYYHRVNWSYISSYQKLSENFIREFSDSVDWDNISYYQTLSEGFIREFSEKVNWRHISSKQTLSENFIKEFSEKVNWSYISSNQKLSENFIRKYHHRVRWPYISSHQTLSENFIREFSEKVDWYNILQYQSLSEDFIRKNKNRFAF